MAKDEIKYSRIDVEKWLNILIKDESKIFTMPHAGHEAIQEAHRNIDAFIIARASAYRLDEALIQD